MQSSDIHAAFGVFVANPGGDQATLLRALEARGFSPPEAWRYYQFIPMACAHVMFRPRGVTFQPSFISLAPSGKHSEPRLLSHEPVYVKALAEAQERQSTCRHVGHLMPMARHSAELNAIQQLSRGSSDLTGIVMTEPLLLEYADESTEDGA